MTKLVKKTKKASKKKLGALAEDERFKEVSENVLFKEMKRKERKIQIDNRFKGMFTDDNFAVGRSKIDPRGRPLGKDERKDLKELYRINSDEEKDDSDIDDLKREDDEDLEIKLDLARGTGNTVSSDEDSDPTSDSDLEEDEGEDDRVKATASVWDKLTSNVKRVEWASCRLAICNMDWDNIKGEDLYMVLNSFKPVNGQFLRLSIYLSDFGAKMLKKEEIEGPEMGEVGKLKRGKTEKDLVAALVREYQLSRMQYYYAIAEFDSVETATYVYEQCDRMEYETSGIHLDLRFVPDEEKFDEDRLKERVDGESVNPTKFKPTLFEASIQIKNPKLTWDDDDKDRKAKIEKAKGNIEDLSAYDDMVACSDEDDNGPSKDKIAALFEAAGIGREKEEVMKIDWEPVAAKDSDDEEESDEEREELKSKKKKKGGTFQDYLERKKLLNRERKARVKELKAQAREADFERRKEIQQQILEEKKIKKAEMMNNIPADVNDERFSALFEDANFAIDKTNKKFKGGNLADQQVQIKHERKRKHVDNTEENPEKIDAISLVEKLKMRTNKIKKVKT